MTTLLPTASRKRLEELLEYLGKTENYSKYYKGNRAEDFKKCFDIESTWCWKYADLVLRGMEKRNLAYAEGHHVVPASFYGKRHCRMVDAGNITVLSYVEHVWAHYCVCYCATGKMRDKMLKAFLIMYGRGICKKRPLMPSEAELLAAIPEMEIKRIQSMESQWAKVEAEGRTHYSVDKKQYCKDYREANREKIAARAKAYNEANREKVAERTKAWYEANKEKVAEYKKAYREANKEKIAESKKAWCEANREEIIERKKAYREANRTKLAEDAKVYYETNREEILERNKVRYEENKDKIAARVKAYYEANKEKVIEREKAYREANKEKISKQRKAYREANKEKISKQKKAWYEANKEKRSDYLKTWREANREEIAKKKKALYEANKEKILEQHKVYYEANKEKINEQVKFFYEAKKAAGFRRRKNPLTGKHEWVFVGLPETPKSSTDAA